MTKSNKMEETKQLKDAIRLRDAYIFLLEEISKSDTIEGIKVYDGALKRKDWGFCRGVEYTEYIQHPYTKNIVCIFFSQHKEYMLSSICLNIESEELKAKVLEILKDYKDLIKY